MEMQEYIETHIIPQYQAFDKAHNEDHVRAVIERSERLAQRYDVNHDMVYVIAAYHDVGLCAGRERHHMVSGEMLAADVTLPRWFNAEQLIAMREAVEDHRASNAAPPRSLYGCIVAEADRLIDVDVTLRRTVQYGLEHLESRDREVHYKRFVEHLIDKYAPGGYLQLWLPDSDNARPLEELRRIIADEVQLQRVFDIIYDEEAGVLNA